MTAKRNKPMFRMIHHVDQSTIHRMYEEYEPVFILSTGRSGSKFVVALLEASTDVRAFHEPSPTLMYFSDYAYHHQDEEDVLVKMIDAARMELILGVYIKEKVYVESNQCLTFFAPQLAGLFKKSKFIHLIRHPGDFVRSAVRKGWHKNDSLWESGRLKTADGERWWNMDQIQRLSWLWLTTNRYIEDFKRRLPEGEQRVKTLKLEDLTGYPDISGQLFSFIGANEVDAAKIKEIRENKINELVIHPYEPPNMKKVKHFSQYSQWTDDMKNKLKGISTDMARMTERYGYEV